MNPQSPVIGREAAVWGATLSEYLTRKMIYLAHHWIAENGQESALKRVHRLIMDRGQMDKSALIRATQWLKRSERDEIIATLIEGGNVVPEQVSTKTKTRTLYVAAGQVAA